MQARQLPSTEKKRYDWVPILLYLGIVLFGWLNIYAACYDDMPSSASPASTANSCYGWELLS